MSLSGTLRPIRTAIVDILTTANLKVDGEGVKIIEGERAHISEIYPPAIWIFYENSPITHAGSAIAEEWSLRFTIASVIKNEDPAVAIDQAEDLASNARDAIIASRTLNNSVRDVIPLQFLPAYSRGGESVHIYGAGFSFEARFRYEG